MLRELRRNTTKHGIHHPLLAIDVENNPDTGAFICAGIYGDVRLETSIRCNGKPKNIWSTERIEKYEPNHDNFLKFLSSLKSNSCILVFFNLSYDKVYFDEIVDHSTVLAVGTRLIVLTLKNKVKAMDLCNHVDGSLEDWIGYLDMGAKFGIAKAELADTVNRVMNDVKATFHLGAFLEDFYYHECGIPLQLTVGSASMRLFTQKFFTDYWFRQDDYLSQYERRAYYGGRCELFKRGELMTYSYDVNSMYLSIMRDELFPDIATAKYCENAPKNWKTYLTNYMGIWNVKVKSPGDIYIPILPVRLDGKLKFPKGEFTGYWTSVELNLALEHGYHIIEVYNFIYYRKVKDYFKSFAEFIWNKRKEYKAKNNLGMDLAIKKIGNTLYGKFAQRNSNDYFGRVADFKGVLPAQVKFFEFHGEMWVQVSSEPTPAKFEFPCISAFITSYARRKLYRAMLANKDSLIYVDTDCIKLTRPGELIKIGRELGEWGLEGKRLTMFRRPKLYGDKHKGVPRRAELVKRTHSYEVWKYKKPLREREAVKRNLTPNVWVEVYKELIYKDDKRVWSRNRSNPLLHYA